VLDGLAVVQMIGVILIANAISLWFGWAAWSRRGVLDGLAVVQMIGVILIANAISLWFGWAAWSISRHEKQTGKSTGAPFLVYVGLIVPPLIVAGSGLLLLQFTA